MTRHIRIHFARTSPHAATACGRQLSAHRADQRQLDDGMVTTQVAEAVSCKPCLVAMRLARIEYRPARANSEDYNGDE